MNEEDERKAKKGLLVYSGSGLWLCHRLCPPTQYLMQLCLSNGPNLESGRWINSIINAILVGLDTVSL